jgi:hypothetical protein
MQVRIALAVDEAKSLAESLSALRGQSHGALAEEVDRLSKAVHEIAGTRPTPNLHNSWAFPPSDVNTLRFVSGSLDKLMEAVDGADAEPSLDAREGVKQLEPLAESCLQRWNNLKSTQLVEVNAKLKAAGKPSVSLSPPSE